MKLVRRSRSVVWLVPVVCFLAGGARAQDAAALTGVYNGKYTCAQGATNLKLSVVVSPIGDISALFTFYLPAATPTQGYTYSLHGQYDPRTAKFSLAPVRWETEHPANFGMVGMNGTFEGDELSGTVTGGRCGAFNVSRDKSETTNIAAVIAAQKNGGKPLAPPSRTTQLAAAQANTQPKTQPSSPAPTPNRTAPPQVASQQDAYMAALRAQAPASARAALGAPPARPAAAAQPPPAQAAAATPRNDQAKVAASAKQPADIKHTLDDLDKLDREMTNPVLKWQLSQLKDPRVGGSSLHPVAHIFLNEQDTIDAAVSCNQNGMSVFLKTDSYNFGHPPRFVWYQDAVEKSWVSDVRVSADGRSHTAKGFPDEDQDKLYSNSLGVFFYKPNLAKQEAREEEFEARSAFGYGAGGTDVLLRPLASGLAADLEDAAATSGGPVTDLLSAKSLRVDLSIEGWNRQPYLDINPQDPVLHKFVADCATRFGLASGPAKPAFPAQAAPVQPAPSKSRSTR